ncbi:MAG: hypothetical protein ABIB71_01910 [Candidatus Woesearchaeota archaeon]
MDTERPAESKSRDIDELRPDVKKFIENYSKITDKICIEVPPHLKANLDCEREYVSLNGELNRLSLYFGKLKKHDESVVALPEDVCIFSKGLKAKEAKCISGCKYIYEISPAVVISDLIGEALGKGMKIYRHGKKCYAVSNEYCGSPFLRCYKVVGECKNREVSAALNEAKARDVILHESILPEAYWERKKALEKGLNGNKRIHLFVFKDKCLICERAVS